MASRLNETGNESPAMYKQLNLHSVDTEYMAKAILEDTFHTSYRHDQAADAPLNKKLRQTYARHFKKRMLPSKRAPYLAIGGPGEGKTSSFKSATKKYADLMGLKWTNVRDITDPQYTPKEDEFIYVQFEYAGESSNITTSGVTAVRRAEDGTEYATKILFEYLEMLKKSEHGCFIMDDVANARPEILGALMPLLEEKGAQGHSFGEHILFAATGNDSSIDGSNANKLPTPFLTRCKVVAVHDTLDFFTERALHTYHDRIGTAGVTDFLRHNPYLLRDDYHSILKEVGRKGNTGPFANSRTWVKLIEEMRPYEDAYRQSNAIVNGEQRAKQDAVKAVIEEMGLDTVPPEELKAVEASVFEEAQEVIKNLDMDTQRIVFSQVGRHEAGSAFQEFTLKRLRFNVLEMSEQMMNEGELSPSNKELFVRLFLDSSAETSSEFAHHYLDALAKESTVMLGKAISQGDHKAIESTGSKLAKGILAPVVLENNEVVQIDNGKINRCLNWVMQGVIQGGYANGKAYYSKTGQPILSQQDILSPLLKGVTKAPTANAVVGTSADGGKITRAGLIVDFLTHNVKASSSIEDLQNRIEALGKLNEVRTASAGAMTAETVKQAVEDNKPKPVFAKSNPAEKLSQDSQTKPQPEPTQDSEKEDDYIFGKVGGFGL